MNTGYWFDCGELTLLTNDQMAARLERGELVEIEEVGPQCPTCADVLHYMETAA